MYIHIATNNTIRYNVNNGSTISISLFAGIAIKLQIKVTSQYSVRVARPLNERILLLRLDSITYSSCCVMRISSIIGFSEALTLSFVIGLSCSMIINFEFNYCIIEEKDFGEYSGRVPSIICCLLLSFSQNN